MAALMVDLWVLRRAASKADQTVVSLVDQLVDLLVAQRAEMSAEMTVHRLELKLAEPRVD